MFWTKILCQLRLLVLNHRVGVEELATGRAVRPLQDTTAQFRHDDQAHVTILNEDSAICARFGASDGVKVEARIRVNGVVGAARD